MVRPRLDSIKARVDQNIKLSQERKEQSAPKLLVAVTFSRILEKQCMNKSGNYTVLEEKMRSVIAANCEEC